MRQLAVALFLGLSIACSAACAGDHDPPTSDAGARAAERQDAAADAEVDAGPPAEIDLHALLIAELIETERSLAARCPCLAASGVYESTSRCLDAVSLGRNWVDCANALDLTARDNPEIRANLRCNIQELRQRSQCLMGSSCRDGDVSTCMSETLDCPALPLNLLSELAVQCHIAFSH